MLSPLKFLPDILIIGLLVYEKMYTKKQIYDPFSRNILYCLLIITLISYLLHYENIFFYIWGIRNLFRFFLYMHVCICFMKKKDFTSFCNITFFFLLVNTPIMFYQGVVMHLFGDNVGGLFGTTTGVNAYTNIHLVLSTIVAISLFTKKKISIEYLSLIILCCFLQAALAEVKFYYIEFVLIIICMFTFSKEKKILFPLILTSSIIFSIGLFMMFFFYQGNVDFFNLDSIFSYSDEAYASHSEGIDRATALPLIKKLFLMNPLDFLFGIGLGNAELTQLYTPKFISNYGYFHIYFFSHAMLFLETGLIGIILYSLFFIIYFIFIYPKREKIQNLVGISLIPLIFCLCIYNQSMRLDSAFLVYTFLSMPYTRDEVNQ